MIVAVTESHGTDNDTRFVDTTKFPANHPYLKAINEALNDDDMAETTFENSFSYGDSPFDAALVTLPAMVERSIKMFVME